MESVHTTSTFQWLHEEQVGRRLLPPQEEGGEPTLEEVDLDIVVMIDVPTTQQGMGQIFKFAFDKDTLAKFLTTYVEHLDVDGRTLLRQALEAASGVAVPDIELPAGVTRIK